MEMQTTQDIWSTLGVIPVGTIIAVFIVMGVIIGVVSTGVMKLYKIFEKTHNMKSKQNNTEQTISEHTKEIQLLHKSFESMCEKFSEQFRIMNAKLDKQDKRDLDSLRHKITVTCYAAIDNNHIAAHLLEDLEKLYLDYEGLGGNTYVYTLMERVRKLPIKHYDG